MYHSITFGTGNTDWTGAVDWKNTWEDWHLIPSSRPTLALPKYTEKFVDIPGMDGSYDFSDYLSGRPAFSDRSGSFEFLIDNDHEHWVTIYRKVATYLHGKRMKMFLEDDPGYYYEGRFGVASFSPDQSNSKISISYRVGPYKWSKIVHGAEDIIWDNFDFETDNVWFHFNDLAIDGNNATYNLPPYITPVPVDVANMPIPGFDMPYSINVLCLSVTDYIDVNFNGHTARLTEANASVDLGPSIVGNNRLILSGHGHVRVSFRDGSL